MLVAYLAHQLGERDSFDEVYQHSNNVANAIAWFHFLNLATRWVIDAPWFPYLAGLPGHLGRSRALAYQTVILERFDALVLVGERMSPHMRVLVAHAAGHRPAIPVVDLLDLGARPPWESIERVRVTIADRALAVGIDE